MVGDAKIRYRVAVQVIKEVVYETEPSDFANHASQPIAWISTYPSADQQKQICSLLKIDPENEPWESLCPGHMNVIIEKGWKLVP